jgi:hypothetical protein
LAALYGKRTAAAIDIETVWLGSDDNDFGAKLTKDERP